jgi:Family of unknown function (DUF5996)
MEGIMAQIDSLGSTPGSDYWPSLAYQDWQDTYATIHMWTQIVGKIRLTQTPWINHSWHTTFYVTPRGLTTSPIPYGVRTFQIDFDFIDHKLLIQTSDGEVKTKSLKAQSVADFYDELFADLARMNLRVKINPMPNEIASPIPFDKDREHASYDPHYANLLGRALVQADRVFKQFRARFIGKCSPVHFFWGGFDLAVTRFSGRRAPEHPGGIPHLPDPITREAYSHEVSSCGFWPGNDQVPQPLFYSYAYPEPNGFSRARVQPAGAFYSGELREFILPYDEVRRSSSPDQVLLEFLQSSYEAAANSGAWDRLELERSEQSK